jgi:hypothetical protein
MRKKIFFITSLAAFAMFSPPSLFAQVKNRMSVRSAPPEKHPQKGQVVSRVSSADNLALWLKAADNSPKQSNEIFLPTDYGLPKPIEFRVFNKKVYLNTK